MSGKNSTVAPNLTTSGYRGKPMRLASGNILWISLVNASLILVFWYFSRSGAFLSATNIESILVTLSQVILLCIAQTILLASAQIDISQGGNVILSSVVSGQILVMLASQGTLSAPLALLILFLAATMTGAIFGCVSGILVGKLGINSLIVTLGMLGIGIGVSNVLTDGANLIGIPTVIQSAFGIARFAFIPLPFITTAVIVAVIWYIFAKTKFGVHSLAIGSSKNAAQRNGINITRHVILCYVITGAMCGVAGAMDIARFATTDIGGHSNDALAAISGAVIGGTSLFGGKVSFAGSILGALLAVLLQSGLVILNFPPFYQTIAIGFVLIVAAGIDQLRSEKRRSA
ncbi:ABC transporter permease [Agrobacterium salinitolerans]|uniref:ABC transporter permease n=2 Tax=Rhizobium/Agrobacterium group TaxID=227290 RepID=UPI001AED3117|nr:ABC transporter permease [Agrobacterium salinitolerans]MCZ7977005.1 ABC transporter permease [Agrobacterium salinitolerans]